MIRTTSFSAEAGRSTRISCPSSTQRTLTDSGRTALRARASRSSNSITRRTVIASTSRHGSITKSGAQSSSGAIASGSRARSRSAKNVPIDVRRAIRASTPCTALPGTSVGRGERLGPPGASRRPSATIRPHARPIFRQGSARCDALGFGKGRSCLAATTEIGEQHPARCERGRGRSRVLGVALHEAPQGSHRGPRMTRAPRDVRSLHESGGIVRAASPGLGAVFRRRRGRRQGLGRFACDRDRQAGHGCGGGHAVLAGAELEAQSSGGAENRDAAFRDCHADSGPGLVHDMEDRPEILDLDVNFASSEDLDSPAGYVAKSAATAQRARGMGARRALPAGAGRLASPPFRGT